MFNIPFGLIPETKIVEIGTAKSGTIHLAKYWGRTASERALVDELEQHQLTNQLALLKLVRDISIAKKKDLEEVAMMVSDLDNNQDILAEYLEQLEPLVNRRQFEQKFKDQIVALFFRERLAFPVTVKQFIKGQTAQEIQPSAYDIQAGSYIKFLNCVLEVRENIYRGSTNLVLKQELFTNVEPGSVGYLWDTANEEYILGMPEITYEVITNNKNIRENLKQAVYEFYQLESIGGEMPKTVEDEKKDPLTSESKPSSNSQSESRPTGKTSTTKSSVTQSQTKSSKESDVLETVS